MSCGNSDQSDDVVCDICQDGDFTEDNLILLCDKCDVAVHQGCYSVAKVPADEETWFCYPCVKTFDPKSLKCTLCTHKGGAYKCTATETISWVHALCSNWIPELYESANPVPKFGPVVHTERLDPKRMRLKCMECNDGGAAVQCFSTSCLKAIHPTCMLRGDNAFTWRVVESEFNGQPIYSRELFCPAHADKVGMALKNESDLAIQISSNSKFEVGSDYFPKAKLEYRDFPFAFKVGRSGSYTGSSSSSSSTAHAGQKRKHSEPASDLLPPTGSGTNKVPRGIPSKRPRATIVTAASKPLTGLTSPLTMNRKKAAAPRGPLSLQRAATDAGSDGQQSSLSFNDLVDSFVGANSDSRARWAEPADDFAFSDDYSEDEEAPLGGSKVSTYRATPQQAIAAPPSPSPMSVTTPLDSQVEPVRKLYTDGPSGSLPPTGRKSNPNNQTAATRRSTAGHAESPEDTPTRITRLAARLSPDAPTLMALPMGGEWQTHHRKVTSDIEQSGSTSSRKVKTTPRLVPNAVAPAPSSVPKPGRAASSTSAGSAQSKASGNGGSNGQDTDLPALVAQLLTALQQSLDAGALPGGAGGAGDAGGAGGAGDSSALFRTLHGSVVGSGSGSSAGGWRNDSSAPIVRYRVGGSSLEASQWSALQRAGWVCLTSIPPSARTEVMRLGDNAALVSGSGSTDDADGAVPPSLFQAERMYGEREEVYITPGTVEGPVETFAAHFHKAHYSESVHYIGSVNQMRAHLAQNPVLTQPWTLTWRELQQDHAWRVVLHPAAYRHLSTLSATEGLPVKCIFQSRGEFAIRSGQSSAQASQSDAEEEDQDGENFVGQWRKQNGVLDGGDVDEGRLGRLREGVHRFASWKGLQYFIHRYPYLLQNDSTLTNTLLCYGWQHRVRIKHEPHSAHYSSAHHLHNNNSSSSSRTGTGMVNNSEFLWETSYPLDDADDMNEEEEDADLMGESDSCMGVWLSLSDLRQRLWMEPARLFQPYDRTLKALSTVHLPPSAEPRDPARSSSSHSSGDPGRHSPVADPAEVDAMRDALARLHSELAQVKQRCQVHEQRAARLADELHRKDQHRKEKKQKRKEEKRDKK